MTKYTISLVRPVQGPPQRDKQAEIYAVRKWGLFELAGFFADPDGPGQNLLEAVAAPFVDVFPRALDYMQISIPPTDPRAAPW